MIRFEKLKNTENKRFSELFSFLNKTEKHDFNWKMSSKKPVRNNLVKMKSKKKIKYFEII